MTQSDLQVLTDSCLERIGGRHNSLVPMLEIKVQRDHHLHEIRKVGEIRIGQLTHNLAPFTHSWSRGTV